MKKTNNTVRVEEQLAFSLYVTSKEVIKMYKPLLDALDLTYTQYLVMLVMWENEEINVKELGERLSLDSGTLTPLLRKLEEKGYVSRDKLESDSRNLMLSLTKAGQKLRDKASSIPQAINKATNLNAKEVKELTSLLEKLLG